MATLVLNMLCVLSVPNTHGLTSLGGMTTVGHNMRVM